MNIIYRYYFDFGPAFNGKNPARIIFLADGNGCSPAPSAEGAGLVLTLLRV